MATNVAGALTYLAGFITGLVFMLTEPYKSNSFIRFHAFQSIFFNVAWIGLWMVWMMVSAILTPLTAGIFGTHRASGHADSGPDRTLRPGSS